MKYDTPDATALARRVAGTMPDGEPLYQHRGRGLDHGAWVPLMAMYPLADIPVLQLSMPTRDPFRLLELGARASVRHQAGRAGHHGDRRLHDGVVEAVVPDGVNPGGRCVCKETRMWAKG